MRIFVLEDMAPRLAHFRKYYAGHELVEATNYADALAALRDNSRFDLYLLDHDLDDVHYMGMYGAKYEKTGMDVVNFITDDLPKDKWPDVVIVHSMNTSRAPEMVARLRDVGLTTERIPFTVFPGR